MLPQVTENRNIRLERTYFLTIQAISAFPRPPRGPRHALGTKFNTIVTSRIVMVLNASWIRPNPESAFLTSSFDVAGLDPVGPMVLITSVQGYLEQISTHDQGKDRFLSIRYFDQQEQESTSVIELADTSNTNISANSQPSPRERARISTEPRFTRLGVSGGEKWGWQSRECQWERSRFDEV